MFAALHDSCISNGVPGLYDEFRSSLKKEYADEKINIEAKMKKEIAMVKE